MTDFTQTRTLDTILEDIESLLTNAARLWGIHTEQTKDTSTNPPIHPFQGHTLHALGPVSLNDLRAALNSRLEEARKVLIEYRDTTLPQAVASGQTGCASLRTFASLLNDETKLRHDVRRLRDKALECQQLIVSACQDESSRIKQLVDRLESIAKKHELQSYREDPKRNGQQHITVTLAGAIVVVDIEIHGINKIEAKVTYALPDDRPDNGTNLENTLIDQLLAHTLSFDDDFKAFEKNLSWLAQVDKYTKMQTELEQVDFFHCMYVLRQDLFSIFQRELSICSGDLSAILLYGHGLPLSDLVQPGPAIAYWAPRSIIIGIQWEALNQLITDPNSIKKSTKLDALYRIHIRLELGKTPIPFLPLTRTTYLATDEEINASSLPNSSIKILTETVTPLLNAPLSFISPEKPLASIRYTACLEPPVVVTANVASEIMRLVEGNDHVSQISVAAAVAATEQSDFTDGSLSFFEALVRDDPTSKATPISGLYFSEHTIFRTRVHENASVHEYILLTGHIPGVLLHRIPFTHPCKLSEIQKLLRQQLVFNTLFKSCFSMKSAYMVDPMTRALLTMDVDPNIWNTDAIRVEIAVTNAPHSILLSFPFLGTNEFIVLEISISHENALTSVRRIVELNSIEQSILLETICNEEKMTQVIRMSESIPLLVDWLLRRFEESGNMDWSHSIQI